MARTTFSASKLTVIIAIMASLALGLALSTHAADTLSPVSPTQGATIDPAVDEFTFSTLSDATVSSCQIFIDDAAAKTVTYNDQIRGRMLQYIVPIADGQHTWMVTCQTDKGEISTTKRNFTAQNAVDTGVKVTSSGVFRGSFLHSLLFQNTATQKPVVVQKLAPGDFLDINLKVPPSIIKKELYVKLQSSKNGKLYLWLEDQKEGTEYTLVQGENVTINISSSHVILMYRGIEYNKATVVVYSPVSAVSADAPPSTERPGDQQVPGLSENSTAPQENAPTNSVNTTAPTQPTPQENTPQTNDTPTNPGVQTPPAQEPPKQGVFKRFFSWLSSLFG